MRSRACERPGSATMSFARPRRGVEVRPVLTAHPTEATPSHDPPGSPAPRDGAAQARRPGAAASTQRRVREQIAEEVTILWQTDEVRSRRPRVVDEIRNGLWFVEASLWQALPRLVRELRERDPGRAAAAAARHVDRRRHGRQPERRSGHDRRRARAGADAGTRPAAAGRPRCSARAWGMSTELVGRRPGARGRRATSRTAPSSSAIWERLARRRVPRRRGARGRPARVDATLARPRRRAVSPTAPSPISVRASRCSDCTWRRSTCASTRGGARAGRARRRGARRGRRGARTRTGRARSTA